jgi:DNA-directed RNA polymerase specialized sigma subunit
MNPFKSTYPSDQTDKELIQQILEGNKTALTHLIERHQPFIYNIAWKMTGIRQTQNFKRETKSLYS